jgi:DNA polymerase-3 subunit epsilon
MKRKIVLDTETTGLRPEDGHRIVEIGAVEVIDNVRTGKTYQVYINPERESEPLAFAAHGLSTEFLKDKPRFNDIVDGFLDFIKDSELVIHNADFDLKFLNKELENANKGKIWSYIKNATCTLKLDKRLFADEKKHNLDAICTRFGIDLSGRTFHGALLDSELLADCYIKINEMYSSDDIEADLEQTNWVRPEIKRYNVSLSSVTVSVKEEEAHNAFLTRLAEKDKVIPVFTKVSSMKP